MQGERGDRGQDFQQPNAHHDAVALECHLPRIHVPCCVIFVDALAGILTKKGQSAPAELSGGAHGIIIERLLIVRSSSLSMGARSEGLMCGRDGSLSRSGLTTEIFG